MGEQNGQPYPALACLLPLAREAVRRCDTDSPGIRRRKRACRTYRTGALNATSFSEIGLNQFVPRFLGVGAIPLGKKTFRRPGPQENRISLPRRVQDHAGLRVARK